MFRRDVFLFGLAEDDLPVAAEVSFIGEAISILHQRDSKASGLPGNLQSCSMR
jgi:hypothetical protein